MNTENNITKANHILFILPQEHIESEELVYLKENFCGYITSNLSEKECLNQYKKVYVCGNLSQLDAFDFPFYIIEELSSGYEKHVSHLHQMVTLGQVPIVVENAGVYYRNFFPEGNYFDKIKAEHDFQELTESTKASKALRKGIYLSDVSQQYSDDHGEELHFHLLRCSSNLTGPTDNFRTTDRMIMQTINDAAASVFEQNTSLNHVLAQIYENKKNLTTDKETKAKIKAHSDKTKDMDKAGLIAFCTFYDPSSFGELTPSTADRFDWCYKKSSGLTRLHFKLKNNVADASLTKEFSVTLYPNSVFIIPLSTNRLYTHEIRPSVLNIDKIPTRMGYVARCSNKEAVYRKDGVFIKEEKEFVKMVEMNAEKMQNLKDDYYKENVSQEHVQYNKIHFSMNTGDYKKPIY